MRGRGICFVGLDNYPVLNPRYGGEYFGGESVQQTLLAREFARQGFAVSMLVKDHGQPEEEWIDGIRVLKTFRPGAGVPGTRFFHPKLSSTLRALRKADADIYYQSCAGMMTGIVAGFCRHHRKTFAFRVAHDSDCIPGGELVSLGRDRLLYRFGLRRADFIFAQSERQEALLRTNLGLGSIVLDMAVEVPEISTGADQDIDALWINNLRPFKRPRLFLDMARMLPALRFTMIGGPCVGTEQFYQEILEEASDIPNLQFMGPVPYAEVNDYVLRAKVLVNTSESEGFPNSFLQAWVRGVPVVSFFDPDGLITRHGLGRTAGDIGDMAAAIDEILTTPGTGEGLSQATRRFAFERYSPEAVVRLYLAAFTGGRG
jgi:glycosyltransferase involved in cell wall biosynthesis